MSAAALQTLGVRAYAGVPLRRRGRVIGSLCAIDMKPRFWGANEVEILVQLAASLTTWRGLAMANTC